MKRFVAIFLLLLVMLFGTAFTCNAEGAVTDTFTKWKTSDGSTKTVVMRPIYEAIKRVDFRGLNTDDYDAVSQIDCDGNGNTYLLAGNGSITVLNSNYEFVNTISLSDESGQPIECNDAKGFSVVSENEIYIADTENARVLYCVDGIVKDEFTVPDDALIPDDFIFQPIKVAKDSKGYLYVLSAGSYYGIVLYNKDGDFVGFYGANTVNGTILTALQQVWDTLTQNDVKRAKAVKKLPYQIIDLCIDDSDFVYTCTGKNSGGAVGQIRMLSPGGTNILTGAESKNFAETDKIKRHNKTVTQDFVGIETDSNGFIYALDAGYGFIYVYDIDSNLIGAFGGGFGNGEQLGVFSSPSSIALNGNSVLVLDSIDNSITVFERTAYGDKVFAAQKLMLKSDYIAAQEIWEDVISEDSFNLLALRGIAKAAYDSKDYSKALKYAELADDSETYSLALKENQSIFLSEHWTLIFTGTVLFIIAATALVIVSVKRRIVLIKNETLRTMTSAVIHPFKSFNDIKYKQKGSLTVAAVLVLLYFCSSVISVTLSNFRYTTFQADTYNSLMQLAQTVGLVMMWTVANWAVCTLMHGRGKIKEVFIVTAYSTFPLTVGNIIITPLSHIISSNNSTVISGITTVAIILAGIMMCIGHMVIHDYSFPQMIGTAIVTVIFMILIVFVLFMIGILLSQFWSFLTTVLLELLRM